MCVLRVSPILVHNIIQPYGSVPWPWNISVILCGFPKQSKHIFYYSYIQAELGNSGVVILPTQCTRVTIHLNNIHTKILFIHVLFHGSTIPSNTIIENTDTFHNILTILTNTIHYLYWHHFLLIFLSFIP
jgi:hypothetical protein